MALWTATELNHLFHCSLPEEIQIQGVSIDSRTLVPGDLYVALHGVAQDGHLYIPHAIEKGAAAVLVSRFQENLSCPQILVKDTLEALKEMGKYARQRSQATVLAITGSVGKTSTKEILAHTLAAFGTVHYSAANFNNHWGVPLSLARLPRDAKYAIFEIGMNHPGEIAPLAQLVRSHICLITNIAPAHIGNLQTLEDIAKEKATICAGLEKGGIAILPQDSDFYPFLRDQAQKYGATQIYTFGKNPLSDISLINYEPVEEGGRVTIKLQDLDLSYSLSLRGHHFAINSLTAFAVALACNLDASCVAQRLQTMPAIKNRGEFYELKWLGKKIILIDDAYNANLISMQAGIDVLVNYPKKGRRIAILGEMLELGSYAEAHHQHIGTYLQEKNVDRVYVTGGAVTKECLAQLPTAKRGVYAAHPLDLLPFLKEEVQEGDILFVKGSKGSKASLIVQELLNTSSEKTKIYAQ